jgi:ribosome maturation factor RimP
VDTVSTRLVFRELAVEKAKQQVLDLISTPLAREGVEIVDTALGRYRNKWTLRLFIYSERGTTLDECARISRIVGDLIDGSNLFEAGYLLEVSSPGLDRPLKTAGDFRRRIGETITVQFADRARPKVTAEIVAATETEVLLRDSSGEMKVGLSEIEHAKIVIESKVKRHAV